MTIKSAILTKFQHFLRPLRWCQISWEKLPFLPFGAKPEIVTNSTPHPTQPRIIKAISRNFPFFPALSHLVPNQLLAFSLILF